MELYKKYRPKDLDQVVGQDSAVEELETYFERNDVPQCLLITGPSGTGKTTLGRIIRRRLNCSKMDYHEKDCTTEAEPLNFVRELKRSTQLWPMKGKVSVWFLEEFQSLSRAGFSQQAMLKLIEDCPKFTYFILATTDPDKVLKTIHSRSTQLKLGPVPDAAMKTLLNRVIEAEEMKVSKPVIEAIIEGAEGGARKALVILGQIGRLKSEEKMLKAVEKASANKEKAFKLGQMMMFGRANWSEVAAVLRDCAGEDAESLRYMILGYARTVLIGTDKRAPNHQAAGRAFAVIDIFSRNFYDSKHAGLAAACWEVLNPA